jgi:hypothetical protein
MRTLRAKICAITLIALIAAAAWADDDPDMLAFLAQSNKRCQEFKQQKAELERHAAQLQTLSREQKAQVTKTIGDLDQVIAETTTLLQDPALKTSGDKKEIAARMHSAITRGNMVVLSAHNQLVGVSLSNAKDRLLNLNIEPFLTRISPGFDGSRRASNGDENVVVVAAYTKSTPQSADAIAKRDGSVGGVVGGGVMLEDSASGLGPVSAVTYDGRYNALMMDNRLIYFIKVPPWDAAALCREISRNENTLVGVSIGKTSFVFGERSTYENSGAARDLMLTDHFLGDFIFGWHNWTNGYNFPNGYVPQTAEVKSDMLVRFAFKNFQFTTTKGGELRLANLSVDVTMMPVSKRPAKNGGMLPDLDELERGYAPPPEFLANARYFSSHFNFFRKERIVAMTLAYGELAALFRSYKQVGINLEALASALVKE